MSISQLNFRPRRGLPPTSARKPFDWPPELERFRTAAREGLAEPFRGVTTDGVVVPGPFPLRRTNVSTAPLRAAAEAFLAALTPSQRTAARFALEDEAWRAWSNVHLYIVRHGVCFEELNEAQRERGLALLRESLSAQGFELARNVMRLNEVIGEITGQWEDYGEWLYWLSFFGTPSAAEPWGWQLDGHHLIVNCLVLGDQVVMTPTFMGSEPVVAESGRYAGTRVFALEEARGLALMRALTPQQRDRATVGTSVPRDVLTTAFRDNLQLPYAGIRYDELETEQQALLLAVVEAYVGRMRPGHAAVKLDEVRAHLGETHFAWIGGVGDDDVFYYCVHSPVLLIEFDHLPGVALDNDYPTRNHIHTVVRTPNGNDYGKDLLRQHYARFHREQMG